MRLFESKKPNIDAMFSEYGDMLYRLALARIGNDADAQDAVQDAFVKYMTALPRFEDVNHEKAWFLRTVINCCNDHLRKQRLRVFSPLDEAEAVPFDSGEGLRNLMSLISRLQPIYKDVVILHHLEGFSLQETADILQISLSAVKMRLSRAREILQISREEEMSVY